jgi:hypothetical protein
LATGRPRNFSMISGLTLRVFFRMRKPMVIVSPSPG